MARNPGAATHTAAIEGRKLDRQAGEIEQQIKACHLENSISRRLEAIPGIGPLSASALAASIGDAKAFRNGR